MPACSEEGRACLAQLAGREAAGARARQGYRSSSSTMTPKTAASELRSPDQGDRGPADGRHERRR
jgi:hypothetical protein